MGIQIKKQSIYLDGVIFESCNMACDYCRKQPAVDMKELETVHNTLNRVLKIGGIADFDIFKISGYGEITLADRIDEMIMSVQDKRLMIITNGTRLNGDLIDSLSMHPDPVLCVSMDGHTPEMNRYRHLTAPITKRLLDGIALAQKNRIPIEVNSVLTNANIDWFRAFLEFIKGEGFSFMTFPFPPRIFPSMKEGSYFPSPGQIDRFQRDVVDNYQQYEGLLPPVQYMHRLVSFMRKGKRESPCYQPSFVIGVNRNYDILGCPCGPAEVIGNLETSNSGSLAESLADNRVGRWKECAGCFNHYEAIGMYLSGDISEQDLKRIPSISSGKIISHLRQIRDGLNNG